MLAEGGIGDLIVIGFIVIAVIVGRIVEYFKKQKAEEEAKARRLQGDRSTSASEKEARPVPGGLQALLDALGGQSTSERTGSEETGSTEREEAWERESEPEYAMDPATRELERARKIEAAGREAASALAAPGIDEEPAEASYEEPPEEGAALPPAPAAARLFVDQEGLPPREQARRGVLWSVVLGAPRATIPYGERGASEAPGGIA